jgi:hypothetical protein
MGNWQLLDRRYVRLVQTTEYFFDKML